METRVMSQEQNTAAMEMINICPSSILVVEDQTLEMQILAVSKAPELIEKINPINSSVIETAVKQDGKYLQYVKCFNEDICLAAVESNWRALKYVPVTFQTTKVVNMAIKNNPRAIFDAYSPSQESLDLAVTENPEIIYNFREEWNTAETIKTAVDTLARIELYIGSHANGLEVSSLTPSEILWICEGLGDREQDKLRTIEFITDSIVATKNKKEEAARLKEEEDSLY